MKDRRIHRCTQPDAYRGGKWTFRTEDRDVILMAVVDKWAMVRRPRCVPYVCPASELLPANPKR